MRVGVIWIVSLKSYGLTGNVCLNESKANIICQNLNYPLTLYLLKLYLALDYFHDYYMVFGVPLYAGILVSEYWRRERQTRELPKTIFFCIVTSINEILI